MVIETRMAAAAAKFDDLIVIGDLLGTGVFDRTYRTEFPVVTCERRERALVATPR
jgi:hypothetical protein